MDQELLPLSEAKTRLHELVRDLEGRDLILVRHGRPVGVLLGFARYRELLDLASRVPVGEAPPAGLVPEVRAELARICEVRGVTRLVLFGSAARGEAGPASDLDLLVEFRSMPPKERADALFGLQEDLERVLGRAVDLLEEGAIDNPYLRRSIERASAVLYEAA